MGGVSYVDHANAGLHTRYSPVTLIMRQVDMSDELTPEDGKAPVTADRQGQEQGKEGQHQDPKAVKVVEEDADTSKAPVLAHAIPGGPPQPNTKTETDVVMDDGREKKETSDQPKPVDFNKVAAQNAENKKALKIKSPSPLDTLLHEACHETETSLTRYVVK